MRVTEKSYGLGVGEKEGTGSSALPVFHVQVEIYLAEQVSREFMLIQIHRCKICI